MTKAPQHGESDITEEVRREGQRTGKSVCDLLRARRLAARHAGNRELLRKIIEAEKFLGCRNRRKR